MLSNTSPFSLIAAADSFILSQVCALPHLIARETLTFIQPLDFFFLFTSSFFESLLFSPSDLPLTEPPLPDQIRSLSRSLSLSQSLSQSRSVALSLSLSLSQSISLSLSLSVTLALSLTVSLALSHGLSRSLSRSLSLSLCHSRSLSVTLCSLSLCHSRSLSRSLSLTVKLRLILKAKERKLVAGGCAFIFGFARNTRSMALTNFILTVAGVSAVVLLLRSDVKQSATIFRRNVKHIRKWLEEESANAPKITKELESKASPKEIPKEDKH